MFGWPELLFLLLALASEVLGTVGGFGSSMFLVTLARLLYPLQTVLAITALLHVASNSSKLWLFRGQWNLRLLLLIGLPGIGGVLLGAWLGSAVTWAWADIALGGFLVVFSAVLLRWPKLQLPATPGIASGGGTLAGFLAGWLGTGGAVRGLILAAFHLDAATFIATSAAIDFGIDGGRAIIYLSHDYFPWDQWPLIPLAVVAAWVGSVLGKRIVSRLSQTQFQRIVLLLIFAIGVFTLVRALL